MEYNLNLVIRYNYGRLNDETVCEYKSTIVPQANDVILYNKGKSGFLVKYNVISADNPTTIVVIGTNVNI